MKLTRVELRTELEARQCSFSGEAATLQDRLWRAIMCDDPHQRHEIPWYLGDKLGAEGEEAQGDFAVRHSRRQAKREEKSKMVTRGRRTDSIDEEGRGRIRRADVRARRRDLRYYVSRDAMRYLAPTPVVNALPYNTFSSAIKRYSAG